MLDLESLRRDLYRAVDDVLDRYKSVLRIATETGLVVTFIGDLETPYVHNWPDYQQEFPEGHLFDVSGEGLPKEGLRILVARSEQEVWSKRRAHIVVFGANHAFGDVKQFTPYAEFIADDLGTFCSSIPNPLRPRESLKKGAKLPDRYVSAVVKPNDELFHSVKKGPALRLVVQEDQETAMIEHAVFVASLRKRF
ncbi:MAG: hypothetical protein J2P37_07365 [Ktedonobacteraceae bacterium]|nr:hypothetical protein [Ktedonobacteraceae bacterium]MBO0789835.1 hypothetical protein [Ktedonobacteraceae bacterium]